jgi:hypothetical protein
MKIIFCDIDGVLVKFSGPNKKQRPATVSGEAIAMLNLICDVVPAQVVVTSDWRIGKSNEDLAEIFKRWGFAGSIVGATPVDGDHSRGREIAEWLVDSKVQVESYAIVDDDPKGLGPLEERLVLVNPTWGMIWSDASKVIRMLTLKKLRIGYD